MKALLKTVPLVIALALCATNTYAEEIKAPFGLTWGASQAELDAMGVETYANYCRDDEDGLTHCQAKKVPKPVSFSDEYWLYFHPTSGLVKVKVRSKTKNLQQGIKRHALVRASLTAKYGQPYIDLGEDGALWERDSGESIQLVTIISHQYRSASMSLIYSSNILAKMQAERDADAEKQMDKDKDAL